MRAVAQKYHPRLEHQDFLFLLPLNGLLSRFLHAVLPDYQWLSQAQDENAVSHQRSIPLSPFSLMVRQENFLLRARSLLARSLLARSLLRVRCLLARPLQRSLLLARSLQQHLGLASQ